MNPSESSHHPEQGPPPTRPLLVVGVCASISAYKAAELVRQAGRDGWDVQVVPTASSLHFVGTATWEALTGKPTTAQLWDHVAQGAHIDLARRAELVVVAPCSAHRLAAFAAGMADDLLGAVVLATRAPVVLAPAMHTEMWQHHATVANVALLQQRGVSIIEPEVGQLAGGDIGVGRLPSTEAIMKRVREVRASRRSAQDEVAQDLAGLTVVVSAGGTREPLDPVRYLGNASSGRQGVALAQAALQRGAKVRLVAAFVDLASPPGVEVIRVQTAAQMQAAMREQARDADVVVMAAAVADWRPATRADHKQRKEDLPAPAAGHPRTTSLELVENPDILHDLGRHRANPQQVVVGFAAETLDADSEAAAPDAARARRKLARKGADLLVVNPVGSEQRLGTGFATIDNQATLYSRDGEQIVVGRVPKLGLAHRILDQVLVLRGLALPS